jgi:anti-sigma factor RsiW
MTMTCETARDMLPELARGALDEAVAAVVERHLDACPPCESERALLMLIRASAAPPPAGLEARIARAVRDGSSRSAKVPGRQLAVAATAAFAVLTGGLLLQGVVGDDVAPASGVAEVTLGWPVVQDPILRATPALDDLSVEELESLLAELES